MHVAEVVAAALRFLSHEWKDKVQIEQNLPEGQTVLANKNMLIHVLVNLFQNSLDALQPRPLRTNSPRSGSRAAWSRARASWSCATTAPALKPQHLDKVFDPFFTTKDVGQGMGLGLTICYRIVQDCAGPDCGAHRAGPVLRICARIPGRTADMQLKP